MTNSLFHRKMDGGIFRGVVVLESMLDGAPELGTRQTYFTYRAFLKAFSYRYSYPFWFRLFKGKR